MNVFVTHLSSDDGTPPTETPAFAHCREIRRVVFIDEQQVSEALEFDGLDDSAEQFVVWRRASIENEEDEPALAIGTARLRPIDDTRTVWKAERVAVLLDERRAGTGRLLMEALEQLALELGARRILLHAQVAVLSFYEKLGYTAHGEVFVEADIEHREMEKVLI